jgi:hypothetical protein
LFRTYALAATGVALTWIGIAIALWARWHLGQYWSARVTIKEDHKLIRTGPYAYFRHPIYSGIDLAAVGGALAIDEWRCVAGVGLIVLGYWIKARMHVGSPIRRSIPRALPSHRFSNTEASVKATTLGAPTESGLLENRRRRIYNLIMTRVTFALLIRRRTRNRVE